MSELIGQIILYEEGSILGVSEAAVRTGREEDVITLLAKHGHKVKPTAYQPESGETSRHFAVEPPVSADFFEELTEHCKGTWDDDQLGALDPPLDTRQHAVASLAVQAC